MSRTILISGGAGFIGTALARAALADEDLRVVLLDNLHPQVHAAPVWPEVRSNRVVRVLGDVADADAWHRAIDAAGPEFDVVHLAAETGTGQSLTEARRHAGVNVLGTAALTDALSAIGVRPGAFVLCSSRAVYGEGAWMDAEGRARLADSRGPEQLEREDWAPSAGGIALVRPLPHRARDVEPRPSNVYAATKLAQEHLLGAWAASMQVPLTVLRLQNVYGAGQALQNSYTGVLTYFARQLFADEVIDVYEGGGIVRDFVHVSDVVAAILASLDEAEDGVRTMDIGSGAPRTLFDVAALMADIAGGPAPRLTTKYRLGDVRAASADITDASSALAYSPRVELKDGLAGLIDYARAAMAVN